MSNKAKNPTSLKTAFIRVSETNAIKTESEFHNYKPGETIHFSFTDIVDTLKTWSQNKEFIYYAIEHSPDEDEDNIHYHIVISFNNPTSFEQIKRVFPLGQIEPCGGSKASTVKQGKSLKRCIQYLVHLNDLTKEQYAWESVITNDPNGIERFKVRETEFKVNEILKLISIGVVNRYNLADYVDVYMYSNSSYKSRINNAFEYYENMILSNPSRNIMVFVIQGEAGSGKTTFAKEYCSKQGWSFSISSNSNDPWSTYRGADVHILDDLRDSVFPVSDLIKMLDPYNQTTNKSRYTNKLFIGKAIIITTNEDIQNWYTGVDKETRKALFRRIDYIYQFKSTNKEGISEYYPIQFRIDDECFYKFEKSIYTYDYNRYITKEEKTKEEYFRDMNSMESIMNNQIVYTNEWDTATKENINGSDGYGESQYLTRYPEDEF